MKTKKEIFDSVKKYFDATPEFKDIDVVEKKVETDGVKQKFEEITLLDGVTVVTVEPALEPNATITMKAEDGTPVPMPIGDYELADGMIIVVEVEGVIAEIKEATIEEEETPVDEELAKDKSTDVEQRVKKVIESITKESVFVTAEEFNKFKEEFEAVKKDNDFLHGELNKQKEMFVELKDNTGQALKEVLSTPTKEPVKVKYNVFKKEKTILGVKIN